MHGVNNKIKGNECTKVNKRPIMSILKVNVNEFKTSIAKNGISTLGYKKATETK